MILLVRRLRQIWLFRAFAICTRLLIAFAFMPSGLTKLLGNRFTILGPETPIGYFFDAMYKTGFYWNCIGFFQVGSAVLLLIPRTTTLGAVCYFPIILNIWLITLSLHFRGTWVITSLMMLAITFLLIWDIEKLLPIVRRHPQKLDSARPQSQAAAQPA